MSMLIGGYVYIWIDIFEGNFNIVFSYLLWDGGISIGMTIVAVLSLAGCSVIIGFYMRYKDNKLIKVGLW